jgi:glycopeptide antibiotics resistance protein
MRWYIAALWVGLGVYALAAADRLFFPVLIDSAARADNQYIEFSLGHWINFVPLRTLGQLLARTSATQAVRQIGGNIGLLFPFGLLSPVLVPRLRRVRTLALAALATSVVIEAIQYLGTVTRFMNRSVDIDDVILNVLGALLGWGVWKAVALVVAARRAKVRL